MSFLIKYPSRVHYSLKIECQAPSSLLSDYLILDKYQRRKSPLINIHVHGVRSNAIVYNVDVLFCLFL